MTSKIWERWLARLRCVALGHKYFSGDIFLFETNIKKSCVYCGKTKIKRGHRVRQ